VSDSPATKPKLHLPGSPRPAAAPAPATPRFSPVAEEAAAPRAEKTDWNDMGSAPKDGTVIVLLGVDHLGKTFEDEAHWRVTRAFDKGRGAWQVRGFWAGRNHGGAPVGFTPKGWKPRVELWLQPPVKT